MTKKKKKNSDNELNEYFKNIELPDFDTKIHLNNLYLLYVLKLNCLEYLNENEEILKVCNYLLQKLCRTDKEQRYAYYIESINWRKYNALKKCADSNNHIEWYFKVIATDTIENIKNNLYFSPFMIQSNSCENLYHFTNLEALKSIVEKNTLWLTRYDFLNDTKEIRYIVEILKNNIDSFKDERFQNFICECLKLLDEYFDNIPDSPILSAIKNCISNVYVLSTSVKEDNLSLWHYYSGGTGCSLKMDTTELLNQIEWRNTSVINRETQVFMREIEYTQDIPKSGLIKTLNTIFVTDVLSMEKRKLLACIHIIYEGIFTKNPKLSQEEEFRVAVITNSEDEYIDNRLTPKFRVSKNAFIPYIELRIDAQTLINEVCIAPLNKTDVAKKGLIEFLKSKKYNVTPEMVKVSEIELRY